MAWLFTIPGTLLAIAGLITLHEFGHFIVAKALGVYVRVFSIGFGGRMIGFTWGETDYRLSWIPFGGYVRMAGADPFAEGGAEPDDVEAVPHERQFMSQAPWKRLLVVIAGPLFNLLLPFVLFTGLGVLGEPQPRSDVGSLDADSPAARAGVQLDDRVTSVDGVPVTTWYDTIEAFRATTGTTIPLALERDGATLSLTLDAAGADIGEDRDPYDYGMGNLSANAAVVVDDPASPAGRAGVQTGDIVTAVRFGGDAVPVRTFRDLSQALLADVLLGDALPKALELDLTRAGEPVTVALVATPWSPAPLPADDALWARWGIASATLSIALLEGDSAAEKAGLLVGDHILQVNDTVIASWYDVVRNVAKSGSGEGVDIKPTAMTVTVRRAGEVRTLTMTPDVVTDSDDYGRYYTRARIGVGGGGVMVAAPYIPRAYPVTQAFTRACSQTWRVSVYIVDTLSKMVVAKVDPSKTLGGPVAIFQQMKQAADQGTFELFRQIGLLSISLGIINLVPIPVLDGGQIIMYGAEWLRGRPLPLRVRERAQQAGVIFVVLLMLAVSLKDIVKLWD